MDGDFGNDSADAAGAYKLFVVRIVLVLVLYLRHSRSAYRRPHVGNNRLIMTCSLDKGNQSKRDSYGCPSD
jgi:hypothetical protein